MAEGLVDAIGRGWRDPRGAMAAELGRGLSEARALVHLMLACGVFFVASLPNAVREARALAIADPVEGAVAAHLFGYLALAPLVAYGLAALVHLVARGFGARGGFRRRPRRALLVAADGRAARARCWRSPASPSRSRRRRSSPLLDCLGVARARLLALAVRREPRRGRGFRRHRPGGGGRRREPSARSPASSACWRPAGGPDADVARARHRQPAPAAAGRPPRPRRRPAERDGDRGGAARDLRRDRARLPRAARLAGRRSTSCRRPSSPTRCSAPPPSSAP